MQDWEKCPQMGCHKDGLWKVGKFQIGINFQLVVGSYRKNYTQKKITTNKSMVKLYVLAVFKLLNATANCFFTLGTYYYLNDTQRIICTD